MAKESAYFIIGDISGKRDATWVKRDLDKLHGVLSVSVNAEKNTVAVDYDTTGVSRERLEKRMEILGCRIQGQKTETHEM